VVGQFAVSVARSPIIRFVIGLLFEIPAAYAGYEVTLALVNLGIPSEWWRKYFAGFGAVAVGGVRLDECIDAGPHCSRTARCTQFYPATEWGDDRGRVPLRVHNDTATSRSLADFD
jgi:hypothetical protein